MRSGPVMVWVQVRWPDGKSATARVQRAAAWEWLREAKAQRGGGMARVWIV